MNPYLILFFCLLLIMVLTRCNKKTTEPISAEPTWMHRSCYMVPMDELPAFIKYIEGQGFALGALTVERANYLWREYINFKTNAGEL